MRDNRKKKTLPIIENVQVVDASSDGQAVGRVDDVVLFIKNAVPGDVVDVQVTRKKNKFREGNAVAIHTYSDKRTTTVCKHFGTCGGCKWQNMDINGNCFINKSK